MLLHGELPNAEELDAFNKELAANTGIPDGIKDILNALPDDTHPMGMLTVALASLSGFFGENLDTWTEEEVRFKTIYRLLANIPVLAAYIFRRTQGMPYIDPDPSKGYVANFLHMMLGKVDPVTWKP